MELEMHPVLQYAVAEINLSLFTSGYLLKQEVLGSEVVLNAKQKGSDTTAFHIRVQRHPDATAAKAHREPDQVSSITGKPIYLAYVAEAELYVSAPLMELLDKEFSSYSRLKNVSF